MKEVFVDFEKCLGCRNCEIYCAVEHSKSKDLFQAIYEEPKPVKRINVIKVGEVNFPIRCRHCEEPICADACPTGALRVENGIVKHDENRCVGCWMCAIVCPFGAITAVPGRKIVLKCDRCPDLDVPACVKACPTNALVFSELDEALREKRQRVVGLISAFGKEVVI